LKEEQQADGQGARRKASTIHFYIHLMIRLRDEISRKKKLNFFLGWHMMAKNTLGFTPEISKLPTILHDEKS